MKQTIITLKHLAIGLAFAGVALVAGVTAAAAANAEAKTASNVRSGPSTSYAVVDTLYAGEDVEITKCNSSATWCYITHPGPDGWVASSLLQPIGGGSSGSGTTSNNCTFHWVIGKGFTLDCGGNTVTIPGPGNLPSAKRVCVYNGPNYTGTHVCVNAGLSDSNMTGYWNNRITSLKVFGGARIRLCQNPGYGGFCNTFNHNVQHLGFPLNNRASSYQTW